MNKQEEINKLKAKLDIIDSAILQNLSRKTDIEKELEGLEKEFEPQNGDFWIDIDGRVMHSKGASYYDSVLTKNFNKFTNRKTTELAALSCLMVRMQWQFSDNREISHIGSKGYPVFANSDDNTELSNLLSPVRKQIEELLDD